MSRGTMKNTILAFSSCGPDVLPAVVVCCKGPEWLRGRWCDEWIVCYYTHIPNNKTWADPSHEGNSRLEVMGQIVATLTTTLVGVTTVS